MLFRERSRLNIKYSDTGHMIYIHQPSLEALASDVRAFIRNKQ